MLKIWLVVLGVLLTMGAAVAAQNPRFSYQARLNDPAGVPLQGSHQLYFSLFRGGTAASAGSGVLLYRESATVSVQDGVVNHAVGEGSVLEGTFSTNLFRTGEELFLQVAVDTEGNVILPRTRLEPVPFAMASADGDVRIPLSGPAPIRITAPGSYYLTGNVLTNSSLQTAITIAADAVTLDLNGYEVRAESGQIGIHAIRRKHVTIRNGAVRGFIRNIDLDATSGEACVVSNVHVSGGISTAPGINTGKGTRIEGCVSEGNVGGGFFCSRYSVIENCVARRNGGTGFSGYIGNVYLGCASSENRDGFSAGNDATVANCAATSNTRLGMSLSGGAVVERCAINDNLSTGILQGQSNAPITLRHCLINGNKGDGVYLRDKSLVAGNLIVGNGNTSPQGTGMIVVGTDNRIEENSFITNADGLVVVGSGNLIIRNSASGSLRGAGRNFVIGSGQMVGQIYSTSGTISADPWANFSF